MVVDPLSLTALTAGALTGGMTFLYGQAAELLRRRRDRKDAQKRGEHPPPELIPAPESDVLKGKLAPLAIDEQIEDELADDVAALRRELSDYVDGIREVDPGDRELLLRLAALREALEAIVGQRITFVGEDRDPSGTPVITGSADVKSIRGALTVVKARDVIGGQVEGTLRADEIGGDADVKVVEVRDVGGRGAG